jgi:hypothetical protein
MQTSGVTRRENADSHPLRCLKFESDLSPRRPGLEPEPITTGFCNVLRCNRLLVPQQLPVVMGPRFRGDDTCARCGRT